jgi:hypothetical protein
VSFKHNPLSNQSFIRLVEIHTGRSGGDVACSIEEYSETARRDCRLLFYMWADADKDKVILLSGKKSVAVRLNLSSFLRHHRSIDMSYSAQSEVANGTAHSDRRGMHVS